MISERGNFLRDLGLVGFSLLAGGYLARRVAKEAVTSFSTRLFGESLEKNVWMLVSSIQRQGPHALVENELRAEKGRVIQRPIGGAHTYRLLDKLLFDAPQLDRQPSPALKPVDMSLTIGPQAKKPLTTSIPIIVAGMGYGLALSERYKLALAQGADAVGTATNTGFGPFLASERKATRRLVVQYSRTHWGTDPEAMRRADAIEIGVGQGGNAGIGMCLDSGRIGTTARRRMRLAHGQDAVVENRLPGVDSPSDLEGLVSRLKTMTGGVPVGVKVAAGKYLEKDLEIAVGAGADFVSVDGAEAGTHQGPPILEDDFGLPTPLAVSRARRFWEKERLSGKVTLLVGGGLFTPGDCLKVLALGADGVYLGTAVLMAASHTQCVDIALPFEPPTQLAYETGEYKDRFDVKVGARSVRNFLRALAEEMEDGVRALGKTRIHDVDHSDLMSIDRDMAEAAGVDLAFFPPPSPA